MTKLGKRINPFEVLRIAPDTDNKKVVQLGQELISQTTSDDESRLIQQSVKQIITNPLERLEHEIFTHHDADYEGTNNNEPDIQNLSNILNLLSQENYNYAFGLLKGFYRNLVGHPQSERIFQYLNVGNRGGARKILEAILHEKLKQRDFKFIQSLALLHQDFAEDFEEKGRIPAARIHWEESRKYWFTLSCIDDFWNSFENERLGLDHLELSAYRKEFPIKLLTFHKNRVDTYILQGKTPLAKIHFDCIKMAAKEITDTKPASLIIKEIMDAHPITASIRDAANAIISECDFLHYQEAKRMLEAWDEQANPKENYENAISYAKKYLEVDENNKRMLSFIVEMYCKRADEFYSTLITLAENSRPYVIRLIHQLKKEQGYIWENNIASNGLVLQGKLSEDDVLQSIKYYEQALDYNPGNKEAQHFKKNNEILFEFLNIITRK